ncbi:serine protease [Corallococcus sp. BB11-1]|uniref:serine protease n=1 Tax=Corallococcus sp. BB11-1 TaxID=2996783 RepID=UPI0022722B42|nr:serine protease [Corallococcus sp. BB11-1]MCY1036500.1 serine protease [Corallococcus sp. BB11-1]
MRVGRGVVVAVSLLGCGGGAELESVGALDSVGQEIVGGVEARPGSHPWIVSLQSHGSHFCGGSIIRTGPGNESHLVLTAAHCIADPSSGLTVVAGAHDLTRPMAGQVRVPVKRTVPHPAYDPDTTMNDVAVLVLERPIQFNPSIAGGCGQSPNMRPNLAPQLTPGATPVPVCLPTPGEQVPDNVMTTVAGWGLTREGGYEASSILRQVGVPTVGSRQLASMYAPHGIRIDSQAMLGAGYAQGGKDACQADSGGPLVVKGAQGYTLQGITSFGIGCARPGLPGVYARVSSYIPWIQQQIQLNALH